VHADASAEGRVVSYLAPSLAACFLGALAFVAFLLHLRRSDDTREALRAAQDVRTYAEARGKALEERMEALEKQRREVSRRVGNLEIRAGGKRLTPEADEKP
jgi:hypothetical protein